MTKKENTIFIISQYFYGNRTGTEITLDWVDHFLRGQLSRDLFGPEDRKSLRPKEAQRTTDQKDQTPGCQPHKIALADIRHRKYLSM